jgi:hypothetical protein
MDERLQQALEFANYRQTLNNQLHKSKIKAEGMLIYAEAGGKFTINQQLLCFVDLLIRNGQTSAILFDDNMSPIQIANTEYFLKTLMTRYAEVTNDYFTEAQLIKKSRSVKSILDIGISE